jgi:hypothetical protein
MLCRMAVRQVRGPQQSWKVEQTVLASPECDTARSVLFLCSASIAFVKYGCTFGVVGRTAKKAHSCAVQLKTPAVKFVQQPHVAPCVSFRGGRHPADMYIVVPFT